jgi:hypothetical protein
MKPIEFKESNQTLTKPNYMTDEECGTLPIHTDGDSCLSCWKMSLIERLKVLIFGRIWVFVRSGSTQPPISLACWKNALTRRIKKEKLH